jgi:chromosome segregation ATPase
MTTQTQPQSDVWTRLGRGLVRTLGFLLRLAFVILLAVAIGVGVYFGAPWAYNAFVRPVQEHSAQLALLDAKIANLRASVDGSQGAQDNRLTLLETGSDGQRERLASAEAELAELQETLQSETDARAALEAELAHAQAENETLGQQLAGMQTSLEALQPSVTTTMSDVARLQQQMALLQIQNGLLIARIQIVAENLGEARTQLTVTGSELSALLAASQGLDVETRAALVNRLTTALALVEASPAAALTELESLWAQLDRTVNPQEE